MNILNHKFGKLEVVELYGRKGSQNRIHWRCVCDCGKEKVVAESSLIRGLTQSCGCLRNKALKQNKYDLSGKYGVGYTFKDEEFYFDLEDYDTIKDYCWRLNDSNYVVTSRSRKNIRMHRLILSTPKELQTDHINRIRHDNRKLNLRTASNQENCFNKDVCGVHWDKEKRKWVARLVKDGVQVLFKRFNSFEDALKTRREYEKKYFGEFAPIRKCD